MTHTPGPWIRHDTPHYAEIMAGDTCIAIVARRADADAIAALPKMIATLKDVVEAIERESTTAPVLEAVRAVIKEAEGKS